MSSSDTVAETEETGNSEAASESNDPSIPPLCAAVDNRDPTGADILTQLLEWSRETSGQYEDDVIVPSVFIIHVF